MDETRHDECCLYAVGDVHGRLDLLVGLFARIRAHAATLPPSLDKRIILLGDYVDRGPAAAQVIDYLLTRRDSRLPCLCLMGNHEAMMRRALRHPDSAYAQNWLQNGAGRTLISYGLDPTDVAGLDRVLPAAHRHFLQQLPYFFHSPPYLFVHAGIDPDRPWFAQNEDTMLWVRDPFLTHTGDFGCRVVHGHSICDHVEILPNRISVDTGAYQSGLLSCVALLGDQVTVLQERGPRS